MIEDGTRFIWGAQGCPDQIPELAVAAAEQRPLLHHRLSRVHGGVVIVAVAGLFA
jgi:hypothetical protein